MSPLPWFENQWGILEGYWKPRPCLEDQEDRLACSKPNPEDWELPDAREGLPGPPRYAPEHAARFSCSPSIQHCSQPRWGRRHTRWGEAGLAHIGGRNLSSPRPNPTKPEAYTAPGKSSELWLAPSLASPRNNNPGQSRDHHCAGEKRRSLKFATPALQALTLPSATWGQPSQGGSMAPSGSLLQPAVTAEGRPQLLPSSGSRASNSIPTPRQGSKPQTEWEDRGALSKQKNKVKPQNKLPRWQANWYRFCLPTQETQEMWVQALGQEDSLEEEMKTHSNIPAWKILQKEELEDYSPWGPKESDTTERLSMQCLNKWK